MNIKDTLIASLVPIFLGFGFVIAKPAFASFPPILLMGIRFIFAASILVWWFPVPRGYLKRIFIASFIANTMQYSITYTGLNYIDASAAVLLVQTEVPFGVIFAYFMLKEKPTLRALIGIGVAFATVSYLKQAAIWFPPKQLALVGGLLASAVGLGALIGQAPLAHLVQAWGWRQALIGCSILGLGIAALYFTLVHDKPSMHHTTSTQPTINRQAIMTVLKNRRNWLLAGYSGLAFSPLAVFGGLWGNPFLQSTYHLNTIESAQYITLAFLGLGIGSPVLGWLADRLNRRMDIMITATIISLITLTLLLTSYPFNHTVLRLLLFLFGLGTGGFMLGFTVAKTLNPTMVAATVVAMINTGDALFGAITEPLVGFLLDHHHTGGSLAFSTQDFQYGLVILPGYLIVAVACAIWAKVYTTQNKQGHMSKKYTNRVRYAPS